MSLPAGMGGERSEPTDKKDKKLTLNKTVKKLLQKLFKKICQKNRRKNHEKILPGLPGASLPEFHFGAVSLGMKISYHLAISKGFIPG